MKSSQFIVWGIAGLLAMFSELALSWSAGAPVVAARPAKGVVVIDAGHGGKDPGTRSRSGILEKNVTLAIAQKVAEALRRQGVDVILTRDSDAFVGVEHRADMANQAAAALFVSIHCDANKSPALNGFTILMSSAASPGAKASASAISQRLKSAGIIRRSVRRDSRGLAVLNRTASPAVLVEAGFLSNARDAARLADAKYQSTIAEAVAGGIVDYLHR